MATVASLGGALIRLRLTNFVVRSIAPRPEMEEQRDGTFRIVEDPVRKAVAYGFGGTLPLSLHAMYEPNEKEFSLAIIAFESYKELLRELLSERTPAKPAPSDVPHEESSHQG